MVIVAYILLIGPISYFVLRRIDRRELAWVTAPILVVLFTACSYGIGRTMKGGDVVVNEISVVRTTSEGGSATVDTFSGIVSPDRSTYDLTVEADALIGQLQRQDGLPRQASDVEIDQGEPAHLRGLTIPVFGFEAVRADRHRRARGRPVRRVEHERWEGRRDRHEHLRRRDRGRRVHQHGRRRADRRPRAGRQRRVPAAGHELQRLVGGRPGLWIRRLRGRR